MCTLYTDSIVSTLYLGQLGDGLCVLHLLFHPVGHVYLCVKVSVDCSDIKPTLNYIGVVASSDQDFTHMCINCTVSRNAVSGWYNYLDFEL